MRRLLLSALAALMLLPAVAGAKILVVIERMDSRATNPGGETQTQSDAHNKMQNRLINACLDVMNTTGAAYDVVPISAMQNKWLQNGRLVRSYRSSGGVGIDSIMTQYDGVIMLNDALKFAASTVTGKRPWPPSQIGCYTCSLTTNPSFYPRVPILSVWGATNGSVTTFGSAGTVYQMLRVGSGAALCSLGVSIATNGSKSAVPMLSYATTNRSLMWFSAANKFVGSTVSGGNLVMGSAAGGVRALIGRHDPAHRYYTLSGFLGGTRPPLAAMDTPADAGADTVDVWERLFSGFAGTTYGGVSVPSNARLIIANVMGASPCNDSLATLNGAGFSTPCEFDAPTFLYALAHLDSLTAGKVWEASTSRLPLKASVVVVGGFTRNPRGWSLGFNDADSVGIKATMDSLNAIGVPITVGVNVDSLSNYPWESAWWNRIGNVRFTPQAWSGIADRYLQVTNNQPPTNDSTNAAYPVAADGRWYLGKPVDVFGRFRSRAFYGDSAALHTYANTTLAADSSIYQGLLSMRQTINNWWPGKASGLLVAPRDDYSPKKVNNIPGWIDSLVYVVRKAGFSSLLTDVQYRDANPALWKGNRDLLRGGITKQTLLRDNLGGLDPLAVLGANGHHNAGAAYQYLHATGTGAIDTAASIQEGYGGSGFSSPPVPTANLSRFWSGFVHDEFVDQDYFQQNGGFLDGSATFFLAGIFLPMEDHFSPSRRANVLRITATELSGNPSAAAISRPGYWTIKSLRNSFKIINDAAGRTVCALTFPEEILPDVGVPGVASRATIVTVVSSLNPSTNGTAVVFSAVVAGANGGTPTGTVQFYSDGTAIGSAATLTSGVASLSYSSLAVGSHTITARYNGSASYDQNTGALAAVQVVN